MTTNAAPRLTAAAKRDLATLRRGEAVAHGLRFGPWKQLVAAGLIEGPQDAPRVVPPYVHPGDTVRLLDGCFGKVVRVVDTAVHLVVVEGKHRGAEVQVPATRLVTLGYGWEVQV